MTDACDTVRVKVFRFDPSVDAEPRYDTFEVPYDDQETILGVLKYIAQHHDSSLAFRESCRIGNCVVCGVKVNGHGATACRKILKEFDTRELVVEPSRLDHIIRDLVCDA